MAVVGMLYGLVTAKFFKDSRDTFYPRTAAYRLANVGIAFGWLVFFTWLYGMSFWINPEWTSEALIGLVIGVILAIPFLIKFLSYKYVTKKSPILGGWIVTVCAFVFSAILLFFLILPAKNIALDFYGIVLFLVDIGLFLRTLFGEKKTNPVFITALATACLAIFLTPFLYMIFTSLKTHIQMTAENTPLWPASDPDLSFYRPEYQFV